MNEIVKKFLLAGDKSLPKIYLRQSEFTYSVYIDRSFLGVTRKQEWCVFFNGK